MLLTAQMSPKINGRIMYDFEFLKREKIDFYFNGNEFRRIYLSFSGNISKNLKYKVETNFAHAKIGFNDMYIRYSSGKYGDFFVGSIAEPTGLNMQTSSKYISFLERAMLTSLQNGRWGAGFHYANFNLLEGKIGWQMSITNNGVDKEGFKDTHLEKGWNYVARISSPIWKNTEKNSLIHLGANLSYRPYKDLKFGAENHLGKYYSEEITTGEESSNVIYGGKYHYIFPGAENSLATGVELGSTLGSLSLQAEYKSQKYSGKDLIGNQSVTGYYAFISYFITGEHRPYKHGSFGRVKPNSSWNDKGPGAIEFLARYSSMEASEDVATTVKSVHNITLGINWYPMSHARLMYNYVLTDDGSDSLGKLSAHMIRFQVDF
jgi:phosphate-selective porin OprO/OprP